MSTRKHVYTDPDFTPGGVPVFTHTTEDGREYRTGTPILRADAVDDDLDLESPGVPAMVMPLRYNRVSEEFEGGPAYPAHGAIIPPEQNFGQKGYVVGTCGHRVAGSEWMAGFRNCERCGG